MFYVKVFLKIYVIKEEVKSFLYVGVGLKGYARKPRTTWKYFLDFWREAVLSRPTVEPLSKQDQI